jgi:ParB-like nuclease domain
VVTFFHPAVLPLLVPIDQVHPYPDNANEGDVEAVIESISTNGFYSAVIAQQGTGVLIAGHTRHSALLALGATQIPVLWMVTDDVGAERARLGDNQTSRLSRWNEAMLYESLLRVQASEIGLQGTAFDDDYMDMLKATLEGPLTFEEEEFAKQRKGNEFTCPNCGWAPGGER